MGEHSCTAALDWLYAAQMFGMKLGLAGITRLLDELGVLQPRARVIHVAGTNGKGSVCAFAESVARAAGYSTGLFTSPHLVRFNERIRVDGAEIADADVARLIDRVREHVQAWEVQPTFFELTLAVAMLYFAERRPDVIILETGMGGRLDATNAVPKDCAVLTPIGFDHMQYLGSTLYDIACEKAAIFAWHRAALTAPQAPVRTRNTMRRLPWLLCTLQFPIFCARRSNLRQGCPILVGRADLMRWRPVSSWMARIIRRPCACWCARGGKCMETCAHTAFLPARQIRI